MATISTRNSANSIVADWRQRVFRLEDDYNPPEALITRRGIPILNRSELTQICGQKKSFKTHIYLEVLKAALRKGQSVFAANAEGLKALVLDTEQSPERLKLLYGAMLHSIGLPEDRTPDQFLIMFLLGYSPEEKNNALLDAMDDFQPDIVILDNVGDFVDDVNELAPSNQMIQLLLRLAWERNCAIVCIIHQNPGSKKGRGHMGTLLANAVANSIELTRLSDNSVSVSCGNGSRGEPFPDFSITFDIDNGTIVETDGVPPYAFRKQGHSVSEEIAMAIPQLMDRNPFGDSEPVTKADLVKRICDNYQLDSHHRNTAYRAITRAIQDGIIREIAKNKFIVNLAAEEE